MKHLFVILVGFTMVTCGTDYTDSAIDTPTNSIEQAAKKPPAPPPCEDICYLDYMSCNLCVGSCTKLCNIRFPGCSDMIADCLENCGDCDTEYNVCLDAC